MTLTLTYCLHLSLLVKRRQSLPRWGHMTSEMLWLGILAGRMPCTSARITWRKWSLDSIFKHVSPLLFLFPGSQGHPGIQVYSLKEVKFSLPRRWPCQAPPPLSSGSLSTIFFRRGGRRCLLVLSELLREQLAGKAATSQRAGWEPPVYHSETETETGS